jgi:GNAT superfamily N-acetyltransferase
MTTRCHPWSDVSGAAARVREALARADFVPYGPTFRLPAEGAHAFIVSRLERAAADPAASAALLALDGDDVLGALVVNRATYESEVYGIPMARVPHAFALATGGESGRREVTALLMQGLEDVLRAWGVAHCSALVHADATGSLHAFGAAGWMLVDSTLETTWEAGRTEGSLAEGHLLRPCRPGDLELLEPLAREAYTTTIRTRFSADPWLPPARTADLYTGWLRKGIAGEFADVVVVAERAGLPVGFNTFKLDAELSACTGTGFAFHGIAAVDPSCRGAGLQAAMLHWLSEWQRARGGRFAVGRVLIQNHAMQRACLRSGTVFTAAYHTFHSWRGEQP